MTRAVNRVEQIGKAYKNVKMDREGTGLIDGPPTPTSYGPRPEKRRTWFSSQRVGFCRMDSHCGHTAQQAITYHVKQ